MVMYANELKTKEKQNVYEKLTATCISLVIIFMSS